MIGAIEPLLGNRRDGPTVVIPGSGGGPSHGAITRVSTPARRSARGEPEHLALDAAEDRERVRTHEGDAQAH